MPFSSGTLLRQLKSTWHSPYIVVYKDPLLTCLLVSVPSILTLRYFVVLFGGGLKKKHIIATSFRKIISLKIPSCTRVGLLLNLHPKSTGRGRASIC